MSFYIDPTILEILAKISAPLPLYILISIYFDFIPSITNSVELLEALNSRKNLKTEEIVSALSKADGATCI